MSRYFSREEAERIFALAAERQQARLSAEENQLTLADLEEAGRAAGIDPAFIRAAASDLMRPDRATARRTFFGLPVEYRESHLIPMAFDEASWRKSVDLFVKVYGKAGQTLDVGTTRRWLARESEENQMPAQIIAEEEEHGTRFTIERKMWPMTLGFGIGAVVNLLIGLIFFTLYLTTPTAADLWLPGMIMTFIGLVFSAGTTWGLKAFGRRELERFAEVFAGLERLAMEEAPPIGDRQSVDSVEVSPPISLDAEPDPQEPSERKVVRRQSKA